MDQIKIIIGGDIVPTKSNMSYFEEGAIEKIVSDEVRDILDKADIRIFNLETPICNQVCPIEKEGPCFSTSVKSIKGIKALNPTVLTLANNHILDQGIKGLDDTVSLLKENDIKYTGIGKNIHDANKAVYIDCKKHVIGVYGCVEHEYSLATRTTPGANPFDPLETLQTINEIKAKCDFLIVLYHGGKEYYEYPSPELQRRCHKIIEAGADIVICQHSHCVGTSEHYRGGKIMYGQGNFILDNYEKAYESYFQTGLLINILLNYNDSDTSADWELIPIKKDGSGVRLANDEERRNLIDEIKERENKISDIEFVEKKYKEYVERIAFRYIFRFSRFGFIISVLDNKYFGGKILNRNLKKLLGKHQRLAIENCLQCEVHNEVIREYLKNDK